MKGRWIIGALACVVSNVTWAEQPVFMGLGPWPGGYHGGKAREISDDGTTVVGRYLVVSDPTPTDRPFRWRQETGFVDIAASIPSVSGEAWDVSADGSVILGAMVPPSIGPFIWTEANGLQAITSMPGAWPVVHMALGGMSANGTVLVGCGRTSTNGVDQAWRWTAAEGMVSLGFLYDGFEYAARDVSLDGQVVVGVSRYPQSQTNLEAFLWTASGSMVGLGDIPSLPGYGSAANRVSGDGLAVVTASYGCGSPSPHMWTSTNGWQPIPDMPGTLASCLYDINYDGTMIVMMSATSTSTTTATVWDPINGTRRLVNILRYVYGLDLGEWQLWAAHAISDDGRHITGDGRNPAGQNEGWIVHIEPCEDGDPDTIAYWNPESEQCGHIRAVDGRDIQAAVQAVLGGQHHPVALRSLTHRLLGDI